MKHIRFLFVVLSFCSYVLDICYINQIDMYEYTQYSAIKTEYSER